MNRCRSKAFTLLEVLVALWIAALAALAITGVDTGSVSWGVTLPGRLRSDLDELMNSNSGGTLVIAADGSLRLEPSE